MWIRQLRGGIHAAALSSAHQYALSSDLVMVPVVVQVRAMLNKGAKMAAVVVVAVAMQ